MLKIKKDIVEGILAAKELADLFIYLQKAIELEHSTIPPYLTAMISLKFRKNSEAWQIIQSVVVEEMLHMSIAANLLNAIGGSPQINHPSFVPEYPTTLPMNVDDGMIVGLEKYSLPQLAIFMQIEHPENALVFPEKPTAMLATQGFATIGQFYNTIKDKIREIASEKLPGSPQKQVTSAFFSDKELFPILTKTDAIKAINIIIEQGEGTTKEPTDQQGELAHYYRFEELLKGKQLDRESGKYIFDQPIPFDENEVWPLTPNTKLGDFPDGTPEREMINNFNRAYTHLLNNLHQTFNGCPEEINNSFGLMYDIKLAGEKLASTINPNNKANTIGPTFEYFGSIGLQ